MKYTIITKSGEVLMTEWYEFENHYHDEILVIIDYYSGTYSTNGKDFDKEIEKDHL